MDAAVMRLVEIVVAAETSPETVVVARDLVASLGKEGIVVQLVVPVLVVELPGARGHCACSNGDDRDGTHGSNVHAPALVSSVSPRLS